ncbi:MAG: phosphatidylserine decarboxylase [Burkholderiales bacterium]|nr:phosphatidylserine decarboxylase [Burkholderiales bacterium]
MSNDYYPHPWLAREGWFFLTIAVAAAILSTILACFYGVFAWLAGLCWLATLFVFQFFRDPKRTIPTQENAVLCPADGRVIKVETTQDPYLQREALKISVFMNVFNVHSNRMPVDGVVRCVWYDAGRFFNAALDKASLENERNALHIVTKNGVDITCVQIAGLIARRILCYVKSGDEVIRGQRYGFIRFGSRVDIYLPPSARARVALGEKVRATETVLAELP